LQIAHALVTAAAFSKTRFAGVPRGQQEEYRQMELQLVTKTGVGTKQTFRQILNVIL